MLILDKARTLDLMIARAEQVTVPDDFHVAWIPRPLAVYEPVVPAARPVVLTPSPGAGEPAPAAA
jgi:hypothetical protein